MPVPVFAPERMHLRTCSHRRRGFSLLEVLMVLAILAILAAISWPSYRQHAQRAERAQARVALMEAAQFMQRFYAVNDRYDWQPDGSAAGVPVALPPHLREVRTGGGTPVYRIGLAAVDRGSFTLAATPVGSMSADVCGTLTLDQSGTRGANGGTNTGTPAGMAGIPDVTNCWR